MTTLFVIITILSFITGIPLMKKFVGFINRIRKEKLK